MFDSFQKRICVVSCQHAIISFVIAPEASVSSPVGAGGLRIRRCSKVPSETSHVYESGGSTLKNWTIRIGLAIALIGVIAFETRAGVVGYVNNPTTNSSDFATGVAGLGGAINTNVNFDAMPTGTLTSNFYTASDGVTLTASATTNQVLFGAGPGQGNTFSPPLSPGEGPHPASNFLQAISPGGVPNNLTISFNTPVLGVGLFTVDYFGAAGFHNFFSIEAFTGQNGTGASLGSFTSDPFNFQMNNLYFMGLTSSAGDIGSLVFSRASDDTGDVVGIDNIEFATRAAVPEPSSLVLGLIAGAGMLVYARSRRGRTGN